MKGLFEKGKSLLEINQIEDLKSLIVEHPLIVHEVDERGYSLLRTAVYHGKVEAAKILLEAGANPNQIHKSGSEVFTPFATGMMMQSCIELLIEYGADANLPRLSGNTLLRYYAGIHHPKAVKAVNWLLKARANTEMVNERNETPLEMVAAQRMGSKVTKVTFLLLLDSGACTERVKNHPLVIQRRRIKHAIVTVMGCFRRRLGLGRDMARQVGSLAWEQRDNEEWEKYK